MRKFKDAIYIVWMKITFRKWDRMLRRLIVIGHELEAIDYNAGKFGGYGFGYEGAAELNEEAYMIIDYLASKRIDVWDLDFVYTDKHGTEWDLEYALQFVGLGESDDE